MSLYIKRLWKHVISDFQSCYLQCEITPLSCGLTGNLQCFKIEAIKVLFNCQRRFPNFHLFSSPCYAHINSHLCVTRKIDINTIDLQVKNTSLLIHQVWKILMLFKYQPMWRLTKNRINYHDK